MRVKQIVERPLTALVFCALALPCTGAPRSDDDEECRELAVEIEDRLRAGDLAAVNRLFDTAALVERVVSDSDAPPPFVESYVGKLIVRLQRDAWFGRDVVEAIEAGGDYKLLRTFSRGGERRALYRMLTSERGLNYHEMILGRRRPSAPLRVMDVVVYGSGERLSVSHRRAFVNAAERESESSYRRLLGTEERASMDEVERLSQLVLEGEHRKAFELLTRLPESVQNEKNMLIQRLEIARELSDAHFLDAIARVRDVYPDDPSLDLVYLDAFTRSGQYRRAFAALDRLERKVGGDPYLNVRRAELYLRQGQYADARRYVRRALEKDPSLASETQEWDLLSIAPDGLEEQ